MNTDKAVKFFRYIFSIPKSMYVNLRLLPIKEAIHLPIIVSNKTKLVSLRGKVNLDKVKTGIVRIGFTGADMIDYRHHRTMIQIDGQLNIGGKVKIGKGSRIIVTGELTLGNNFITTGDSTIICENKMSIGENTMLSWECVVMDTDQHKIFDNEKKMVNESTEVTIGKNVWIGARSFILKSASIEDGCIIGANTTLSKSFPDQNVIIAGNPPKIIKRNISWQH